LATVALKVGTFNLNNLFSRFDFEADVGTATTSTVTTKTSFTFADPSGFRERTYQGRLVKGKPDAQRKLLASRIREMDLDVLGLEEVEDIDTLREFNSVDLGGLYRNVVLVEGNDPRLIDVALLSKHPLGAVTSWAHLADPLDDTRPVFSRDLLQVEVLTDSRARRRLTVFVNHLKSHYVPFNAPDPAAEEAKANRLRKRQCEVAAGVIAAVVRADSRYVVLGDMNDSEDSEWLAPLVQSPRLGLVSGLTHAIETRPAPGKDPPPTSLWTERFKPSGKPPVYTLMDQVWLSPALAPALQEAFIGRRTKVSGDGSDHDPSWVVLDI
jgi:endonuclease/exonuclease/phosphatase family metal-dependent hydrolase